MMTRRREPAYCFGVAGVAKAPWRPTLDQAHADAADAGFAEYEEHEPEHGQHRQVYLHALAEIWTTHDLVPVLPREAAPPPPVQEEHLSRIERIIARREGRGA
jgi:hypothetical protein